MSQDLTREQQIAFDLASNFLRKPLLDRPYWVLHGLAGTGKTHVLAELARAHPKSLLCAFTGKAASVLRFRTGLQVSTIHSAVMNFTGLLEDENLVKQPIFVSKEADFSNTGLFVDESSTVGEKLAEELIATGAHIIACGDPGQLPPVRDSRFFDEPDYTLTEVHRQALDSPIIRQAHAVRSGGSYKADGDDFRVIWKNEITPNDLRFGEIALCYKNETRRRLNASRRRAIGLTGTVLRAGEPVMVLRNDHRLGVYNGAIYEVAVEREPGDDLQIVDDSGRHITLINTTCEMIDKDYEINKHEEDWSPVTLAYATTVHKFQGSESNSILLVDEYGKDYQRAEWLYTGITRAAKRIMVIRT